MTNSVNEGEDADGATGQGSIFFVSIFVWILWPAVFVLIFRDAEYDFVGAALRYYFFYPPSLNNVTLHWIEGDSVCKSLYLSAWFVNTLLIACRYGIYLFQNPRYLHESVRRDSIPRMLFLGVAAGFISCGMYSDLIFDSASPLSLKEELLLTSNVGLMVGLPAIYLWVACAAIGALFSFLVVWRKLVAKSAKE